MTTDLLTFFQPEESSGRAATFSVGFVNAPAIEVWVLTPEKVDLSRFAKTAVSSDDEWKSLDREIQTVLQSRGGLLAYAQLHNDGVKMQLLRREASGYTPPKRMLHLTPGGNAQLVDIKSVADLEIGDHLVLPVDHEAEARLNALCNDLKGLPSDLESSVLNIIRRPSLEWRLDRIERTLSLPPATQADQRRSQVRQGSFLEKLYGFFMWKLPIGPVVSAALVLTAGVLFADHWHRPLSQNTGNASTTTSESAGTNSDAGEVDMVTDPPPAPPKVEPKDLSSSLAALFGALKNSNNEGIKKLYTAHFENRQKDAVTNPDVAWGITKLTALELGFIDKNHPKFNLNDRLAWSDTEAVYRDERNRSILNDDKSAVDLLAYTWCQQNKAPALPPTPKYKDPLSLKSACADVKPEDAVPGLEALTAWVNKQSEQIQVSAHK